MPTVEEVGFVSGRAFRRAKSAHLFIAAFAAPGTKSYCEGGVLGCAGAELGAGVIDFGGRGTFFFGAGFFGSLSSTTIFFGGGGGAACNALI